MSKSYDVFELGSIGKSGSVLSREFEFAGGEQKVLAITIVSNNPQMAYLRGQFGITINNEEVLPEEFHAQMLMSNSATDVNARWFTVDVPISLVQFRCKFTDRENALAPHVAYEVFLYVKYGE